MTRPSARLSAPALCDRLSSRPRRFNLVIDALDEAATPQEARELIADVLVPLARAGGQFGVQILVGTRRADDLGDLIGTFGADAAVIDLDGPVYFSQEDLAEYARVTLQLTGAERPDNPYADLAVAAPVADRIAALAGRNFLIAGLAARSRAMWDIHPVDPARVFFTATVADALGGYVNGLPNAGDASALTILTALAYAETPGLSIPVWHATAAALGGALTAEQLGEFARSSATNFLIETGNPENPRYRLFHQALNDALLAKRREVGERVADERKLFRAWLSLGRATGWAAAPEYLLWSLPAHADGVGSIDELLSDDEYLLYAQLDRLLPLAGSAGTARGKARGRLLQRTPRAMEAPAAERAALFSVVDRLDRLDAGLSTVDAPYEAAWAHTPRRLERTVLEGHTLAVCDVCAINVDGRSLLASAGEDGTVRLWDPLTNQTVRVLSCHDECVRGVCAVSVGGRELLATASHDGTVCLWDPRSEYRLHIFSGHHDWVRNVCAVPMPQGDLLVSAGDDGTVRVWDVGARMALHVLAGHRGWVTAVTYVPDGSYGVIASTGTGARCWPPACEGRALCALPIEGREMLVSAGADRTIRLWETAEGRPGMVLSGHGDEVTGLTATVLGGRPLLISTSLDRTVRLWDPRTGRMLRSIPVHHRALACCQVGDLLVVGLECGLLALAIRRV